MVRFNKKISTKNFIISHLMLLAIGLIFLGTLYYILNIQYQKSTNPFSNGPVTSKPKSFTLTLDQPEDEALVFNNQILISGKTAPFLQILIFTDTNNQIVEAKADGSFSYTLNLEAGVNNIKIVAFDPTGDSREAERVVYYSEEKI